MEHSYLYIKWLLDILKISDEVDIKLHQEIVITYLAKSIAKSIDMSADRAKLYATSQYMIRMIIIAVVMFVSVKSPKLNLIGVFLGLIGPKMVILSRNLIFNKLRRKES